NPSPDQCALWEFLSSPGALPGLEAAPAPPRVAARFPPFPPTFRPTAACRTSGIPESLPAIRFRKLGTAALPPAGQAPCRAPTLFHLVNCTPRPVLSTAGDMHAPA